jgi:hypothetical protein
MPVVLLEEAFNGTARTYEIISDDYAGDLEVFLWSQYEEL